MWKKARSRWPAATSQEETASPSSLKRVSPRLSAGCSSRFRSALLKRATDFRDANIHDPKDYEELKSVVADGWAFSWWCESKECEARVKEDTKATTRNIPLNQPEGNGTCIVCGKPAKKKVYFAKAY